MFQRFRFQSPRRRGFTLIELLVVIRHHRRADRAIVAGRTEGA